MSREISESRKVLHDQWRQIISTWESSDLSQTKFCIEQGLNLRTFQYWRRKYNNPQNSKVINKKSSSVKIVQVQQEQFFKSRFQSSINNTSIKVHLRDVSIDLDNNFCDEALSRLIRVLRAV